MYVTVCAVGASGRMQSQSSIAMAAFSAEQRKRPTLIEHHE